MPEIGKSFGERKGGVGAVQDPASCRARDIAPSQRRIDSGVGKLFLKTTISSPGQSQHPKMVLLYFRLRV
jgi:hypothetical protein